MNCKTLKNTLVVLVLLLIISCQEDSISNPSSRFVQLENASSVTLIENSGQQVEIVAILGGPQSTDTQVDLDVTGEASRYNLSATSFTIPAGETSGSVIFTPVDDDEMNGDVDIVVSLSTNSSLPVGIAGQDANAVSKTISIVDDNIPCNDYVITITKDNWASETYWYIKDDSGSTVASGGPYADGAAGDTEITNVNLADGCYTFRIWDAYGDGQVSTQGNGGYLVNCGAIIQASGDGVFDTVGLPGATAADLPANFSFLQQPTTDLVGFVESTDFCVNQ